MITDIFFFWRSMWVLLMIQKILCTPYFSHRVFEEIIYLKTTCRWSNELGLIKGECYKLTCYKVTCHIVTNPRGSTNTSPRDAPLGEDPCHLYINSFLPAINTTVIVFVTSLESRYHCNSTHTVCSNFFQLQRGPRRLICSPCSCSSVPFP
jgi:hypothetical protein